MTNPIENPISHIAIIGSGFSGTLLAVNLLRKAPAYRQLKIILLERQALQFGRGVAYSTALDCQLLNVPAGNMSALPDDPQHFLRWAEAHESEIINPPWVSEVSAATFLPRLAYGNYLENLLDEAQRDAGEDHSLIRITQSVKGVRVAEEGGVSLVLADGTALLADEVVLALGNFPPGNHQVVNSGFYASQRYFSNPWSPGVLDRILETRSCLLVGSGLTMVDWAMALKQADYQGQIHSISRRGLWPQAHKSVAPTTFGIDPDAPARVTSWLKSIREHIRTSGADWRAVIDALRPTNQNLWKTLSLEEKRRFLRHLRPFWDCHRHRLAPLIASKLQTLLKSGKLIRHVGHVIDYQETADHVEVIVRPRQQSDTYTLSVDAVINCSGSASNYRKLENPLVQDLLRQGLIRPDALNLGLDVAPGGALIDLNGHPSRHFFTLGPPAKGTLWETTAVPEIRNQAVSLAEKLLSESENVARS